MGYWQRVIEVIKQADVILFIRDARMPDISHNLEIQKRIDEANKNCFTVFNKTDLISKKALEKLRKENKNAFFTSVSSKPNVSKLRVAIQKEAKKSKEKLQVGIVGYPNVGKSAITNALLRQGKTKVSSKAGTTMGQQWVSNNQFKIIDSPGVIPFDDDEIKLGILGARNPEKLKTPEHVATTIIGIFLKNNIENLENHYGIKIEDSDEYEILLQIGKKKNFLKKGGMVEEARTALMIIQDWQKGKLRF